MLGLPLVRKSAHVQPAWLRGQIAPGSGSWPGLSFCWFVSSWSGHGSCLLNCRVDPEMSGWIVANLWSGILPGSIAAAWILAEWLRLRGIRAFGDPGVVGIQTRV